MKKIITLSLCIILIFSALITVYAHGGEHGGEHHDENSSVTLLCSDVNSDNCVTVDDARLVLRASIGMNDITGNSIICADTDCDGKITVSDARHTLRTAINLCGKKTVTCTVGASVKPGCETTGSITYTSAGVQHHLVVPCTGHRYNAATADCNNCGRHDNTHH